MHGGIMSIVHDRDATKKNGGTKEETLDWSSVRGMVFDLTEMDPEDGKPWNFNDMQKRNKS